MAKSIKKKDNEMFSLVSKATQKVNKTPKQEIKKGVVKPVEKKFIFNIREDWLKQLKRKALDEDTTVKNLILDALKDIYKLE